MYTYVYICIYVCIHIYTRICAAACSLLHAVDCMLSSSCRPLHAEDDVISPGLLFRLIEGVGKPRTSCLFAVGGGGHGAQQPARPIHHAPYHAAENSSAGGVLHRIHGAADHKAVPRSGHILASFPVSTAGLIFFCADYKTKVTQPIALKTIEAKVKSWQYRSKEEFLQDIKLLRDNCYKYLRPSCLRPRQTELSRPHARTVARPRPSSKEKQVLCGEASAAASCGGRARQFCGAGTQRSQGRV
jgi:hypothetical protein